MPDGDSVLFAKPTNVGVAEMVGVADLLSLKVEGTWLVDG